MAAEAKRFGRYEVQRVLGEGAMGVVYEGLDPRLHRTVAIKTILTNRLDSETAVQYRHRFMREAQAVARLNHPGIVQIHDFGEEGDTAYIVMEYVRGRELNSFFNSNTQFEIREAVRIMIELLDALEFAHQAGIVHRDVKPANVMIDGQGRAKLTDFGVARVTESEHTLAQRSGAERTQAGAVIGTPAYMSPEQITGEAVDHRTDIFSAGIIFYQLLTGEKPFGGTGGWTVAKKIVQDDPPLPSTIKVNVPALFDHVVKKALAKQASERFQSAREFATELKLALEGKSGDIAADATLLGPNSSATQAPLFSTTASPKTQPPATSTTPPARPAQHGKPATSPGSQEVELEFWRAIKDGNDPEDFELYVQQFPSGIYANLARRKIDKLRGLETSDTDHRRAGTAGLGLDAEELARRAAEDRRRKDLDERLAKEAAERRAREEAEATAKRQEAARREAETKDKQRLAEEKARFEAEAKQMLAREKAKLESELARREAEFLQREAELKARTGVNEKAQLEAIEKARLEAVEKARQEAAAEIAKREADYRRREAELRARTGAEEKARLEAIEKARLEAIEKAKQEAAVELAKREAEYRKREAEATAKIEAAARARREAEEQAKREAELRARQEAELKAKRDTEEKARLAQDARARTEAESRAKKEAEERAKREAEYQKREAELKKREADEKSRREAAERARKEAEERVQRVQRAMDIPAGAAGTVQAPAAGRKPVVAVIAVAVLAAAAGAVYWSQMPNTPQEAPVASQPASAGKADATPVPAATPPAPTPSEASAVAAPAASGQEGAEDKAKAEAVARREAEDKARQAALLKSKKEAEANAKRESGQQSALAAQEKAKRDADEAMAVELALWDKTKTSTNPAAYDEYLNRYPSGHFAALAKTSKESLIRNQQEAKELAAQRARLEEEKRKAKEHETRNQAESQALEQQRKTETKADGPRKSGVFVAPTF